MNWNSCHFLFLLSSPFLLGEQYFEHNCCKILHHAYESSHIMHNFTCKHVLYIIVPLWPFIFVFFTHTSIYLLGAFHESSFSYCSELVLLTYCFTICCFGCYFILIFVHYIHIWDTFSSWAHCSNDLKYVKKKVTLWWPTFCR